MRGEVTFPGCKSLSHRALIFGLLAEGQTTVTGILRSEDVLNTRKACEALGAHIVENDKGMLTITGTGLGALLPPQAPLDFGNSGTGARLMMGVIAGHGISAQFCGDMSLSARPMARIINPLISMGAHVRYRNQTDRLPLTLQGAQTPIPLDFTSPVASAQLKSAILLAGLTARGKTTVREKVLTRDHTERMMKAFGANIRTYVDENASYCAEIEGGQRLNGQNIIVPSDPSSVAFAMVAALITQNAKITFKNVLLNPLRTGLFTTLKEMGANFTITSQQEQSGDNVGDITVTSSKLKGVDVPAERAASMIDEYPIAAIAASFSSGTSRFRGLSELKVKESNRLQAVYDGLRINGVNAEIEGDDLIVHGSEEVEGGGMVKTHHDHRIAMSFLIMGLAAKSPVKVDDITMIATSFPDFMGTFQTLGARIDLWKEANKTQTISQDKGKF